MRRDGKKSITTYRELKLLGMLFCSTMVTLLLLAGCLRLTALILSPNSDSIKVTEGDTVHFQGAAVGGSPFGEKDESDNAYGYFWETDGNPLSEDASTTSKNTKVVFNEQGTFTISLTVMDKMGNKDTASLKIFVKAQEEVEVEPLEAIVFSPTIPAITVAEGDTVTFKGEGAGGVPFTAEGDVDIEPYGYFWDTGGIVKKDSESEDFKEIVITFQQAGVFTIPFTVKDSRGVIDTSTLEVTVTAE